MKKISLLTILVIVIPMLSWADLVSDLRNPASIDDVVIDEVFVSQQNWQEPLFASQGKLREIASFEPIHNSELSDWSEPLEVQAEIPYSYPGLSRLTVQMRALAELEKEEAQ